MGHAQVSCHNPRARSWVLAHFSLSPTYKCQLADKEKRFILNTICFILSAKLWIIHNTWTFRGASRYIKTLSQTISSVKTRRLTVMPLYCLRRKQTVCCYVISLCVCSKMCSPWMCFSFSWNVAPSISIISLDAFGLQSNIPQRAPGRICPITLLDSICGTCLLRNDWSFKNCN